MRTYSEQEVSAIIARAVERQQDADAGANETGLTLDEIERVGRESGIDPAHLRAAAAEVDAVGRTLAKQTAATRTEVVVERWIDAPFRIEAWEDVVAHLREAHGAAMGAAFGSSAGETVRQVGSSYEWAHTDGLGVRTRVTVSPRDGRTRLRMTQLVGLSSSRTEGVVYGGGIAAVLAVLVGGLASVVAEGVLNPAWAAALAFAVLWAVAAPTVSTLDRRWRAKKLHRLDALADDLAPLFRRETAAEPAAETVRPLRLDLDALDPAPLADAAETDRATRTRA